MYISCNILKKHIKKSEDIDFLALWDKFTIRTAEVEGVEVKGKQIDKVVTAKIIECKMVPDSEKLHLLTADTGKETYQIVCGAPNARLGLISALVLPGGHVEGVEIGVRKLAGYESQGMLCSAKELGISDDHTGIIELPIDTPIGRDIKELYPIEDIIVEIDNKSLTNRPDLWGHYGIAREVAAITGHELLPLELNEDETPKNKLNIKINNPELCYRYVGTKLDNIINNKTPMWMQIFLYYAGMRSISLIVDLTNYIMLELGQPMHAFDSRVVKDIEVGVAKDGDVYHTLDGNPRKLTPDDLMIKNGGKYFAIAGVMGGLDSEIVEDTTSIVLESATFEPSTIRKTAIRLGLRTEASARYEKSLDPNMAILAAKRFIKLLKDQNPTMTFGSAITDVYPTVLKEGTIVLDKNYLYKFMGFNIEDDIVMQILTSLDFNVKNTKSNFKITVPTFRATKDITIPNDIIEEISRMYGYENFEHVPLRMDLKFGNPEITYDEEYEVKDFLANRYNLHEIHTYLWNKTTFLKKLNVTIENTKLLGKSDDNILRKELGLSMLEAAAININNYEEFGIFEIGTVVEGTSNKRRLAILLTKNIEELKKGYYQLKDITVNLFKALKDVDVTFEPGEHEQYYNPDYRLAIVANNTIYGYLSVYDRALSNKISKKKSFIVLEIDFDAFVELPKQLNEYKDISKYPASFLDYTIITKKGTYYSELETILNKFNSPIILKRELKDIFVTEKDKRVTIRFTVGSMDKTLSNDELAHFKEGFVHFLSLNELGITEE
jgi:phenylalanyl-tRNA synthetase beta chain